MLGGQDYSTDSRKIHTRLISHIIVARALLFIYDLHIYSLGVVVVVVVALGNCVQCARISITSNRTFSNAKMVQHQYIYIPTEEIHTIRIGITLIAMVCRACMGPAYVCDGV